MIVSSDLEDQLRFFGTYPTYKEYLLELDPKRFRGLGEDHTLAFVRVGVDFAKRHALQYRENVQYVLFLMTFIGSHFETDPRYQGIYQPFADPSMSSEEKVQKAARRFQSFAKEFLGEDMSVAVTTLDQFFEKTSAVGANAHAAGDVLTAFSQAYGLSAPRHEALLGMGLEGAAARSCDHLQLSEDDGLSICLALSLWLGTGFARDPLYPWVRDITATDEPSQQRAANLRNYAIKRLTKDRPEKT